MKPEKYLAGRYVLIANDEEDVLKTLVNLLNMCRLDTALIYVEAEKLMEKHPYDTAILGIMGGSGYDLVEIANRRHIPAVMLTTHGFSVGELKRSALKCSAYYAPKDMIFEIIPFLAEVIQAAEKVKKPWTQFARRLGRIHEKKFHGTDWRDHEESFVNKNLGKRTNEYI